MEYLLLIITILGFSGLIRRPRGDHTLCAIDLWSGMALIPLLYFTFFLAIYPSLGESTSHRVVSTLVFATALLGFFSISLWKKNLKLITLLLGLGIFLWSVETLLRYTYQPSEWDEFSHWLTMPAQIVKYDRFFSRNFSAKVFLGYTPGWTILQSYAQAFGIGLFRVETAHRVSVVFSSVSGFVIFQLIEKFISLKRDRALFLAFCFVSFLYAYLAPNNLLIEPIQFLSLLISFLIFFELTEVSSPGLKNVKPLHLGISLAFVFFVKSASLLFVFMIFSGVFFARRDFRARFGTRAWLSLCGPMAIAWSLWFVYKNHVLRDILPAKVGGVDYLNLLKERCDLLVPFFFRELPRNIIKLGPIGLPCFLFFFFLKGRLGRRYYWTLTLSWLFFLFGLLALYLFVLGEREGRVFASMGRYLFVPSLILSFFGALYLWPSLSAYLNKKNILNKSSHGMVVVGIAALFFLVKTHWPKKRIHLLWQKRAEIVASLNPVGKQVSTRSGPIKVFWFSRESEGLELHVTHLVCLTSPVWCTPDLRLSWIRSWAGMQESVQMNNLDSALIVRADGGDFQNSLSLVPRFRDCWESPLFVSIVTPSSGTGKDSLCHKISFP